MRKYALVLIVLVAFIGIAAALTGRGMARNSAAPDDLQPMSVRGHIWDSVCAAAGSHGKVMAKLHAQTVTDCTLACVKGGAQFVLFEEDDKVTFLLDDQARVKKYAGQTVTVVGNYDRATNTLHIDTINTEP
jgi:hypothetical protein